MTNLLLFKDMYALYTVYARFSVILGNPTVFIYDVSYGCSGIKHKPSPKPNNDNQWIKLPKHEWQNPLKTLQKMVNTKPLLMVNQEDCSIWSIYRGV